MDRDQLQKLNKTILLNLDAEYRRIEDEAKERLRVIDDKRRAITEAERLQLEALGRAEPRSSETEGRRVPRARIGPQRYVILNSIRARGPVSPEELIQLTGLSDKRVRDQLRSDVAEGVIDPVSVGENGVVNTVYRLAPVGGDLLARFESYRKAQGIALPTLASVLVDGDDEGKDDDDDSTAALSDVRSAPKE